MRILLSIIVLLIPFCVGWVFLKKEETITLTCLAETYLLGQVCLWALLQVLAVPLVQWKAPFTELFFLFLGGMAVLMVCGILRVRHHRWEFDIPRLGSVVMWIVLLVTVGLIVLQLWQYVFGMHLDEDDARWIVEAGDAIAKNTMFLHNPATGEYLGSFQEHILKDVYSPFPMYLAVLSKLTMIRPAVMAHTIYAPVLLMLMYLAFWRLGRLLFPHLQERIIFLLGAAVVNLFFSGGSYSGSAFALTRIWQGKAVVAGVMIPLILAQIVLIQQEDTVQNWLVLCMMGCAGSLLSGMGILISLIMIGGYGLYIVACKRWRRIPLWLLALVPAGVYEICSQMLG